MLPDQPIEVYGPATVSGTRDTFVEMVMVKGCEKVAEFAKAIPDEKARVNACKLIREDGKYIESGEDYNILVQKLAANDKALAMFGYSFYEQNKSHSGEPYRRDRCWTWARSRPINTVSRAIFIFM